MWFNLAHCAFEYWSITIIITWAMSDNYLFNLNVRKSQIQKTSPWNKSMKIATRKKGTSATDGGSIVRTPSSKQLSTSCYRSNTNSLESYQIISFSRWHLIKQNHETFTKVHEIVWLRHSEYIYQDKVLQIPHSKFPYITFMSWKRLQACPVNSHHRRRTGSRAVSGANSSAGQGNSGECGNNARWWSTSFKRYDALKPCK